MASNPQWLLDTIHFYSPYGWFAQHHTLLNDELATLLQKQAKDSYWGELKETYKYFEQKEDWFYQHLQSMYDDMN